VDLESVVRSPTSTAGWEFTLTVWRDLSSVTPNSLEEDEQEILIRTMRGCEWSRPGLSPTAREFVLAVFDHRIQSARKEAASGPAPADPWTEIERLAQAVRTMSEARELHPWALHRFLDRCEGLLGSADSRLGPHLQETGLTREQYLRRLRAMIGAGL
jgi:hypothetical protein